MTRPAAPVFEPALVQAWIAAGVRHELMMRVLPALRHDMAGPLSVARMGNTVLRRYLSADPFNPELSLKRLSQTEEQLNGLVVLIRGLGRWDVHATERAAAPALLDQALLLMRPLLDTQNLQIAEGDSLPDLADWPSVAPPRLLYLVIGALIHLQESAEGAGGLVRMQRADDGGLRLRLEPAAAAGDQEFPAPVMTSGMGPRPLRIDAQALQCLAIDLGAEIGIGDRQVVIAPLAAAEEDAPAAIAS
jgi:hypothetical protein